jgi:hypothetical protein
MEFPLSLVSISITANNGEVDEAHRELLDSRLLPVNANKTLPVWQYFAMVKDGPIMCNGIQNVYYCLLCLKKRLGKFLDSLVAVYNGITGNTHKHIASMHASLHLACKRQLLEPKQLISISTFASASTNNIRAFIKSDNDAIIKCLHSHGWLLIARHYCRLPLMST